MNVPSLRPSSVDPGARLTALAAAILFATAPALLAQTPVCERTYTLDADFDEGTLLNVNHDVPDQLQLNRITTPFPFVNIACSARGTVVRIDVNTGDVLGEYRTAPDGMGRDPSRTTVDKFGNVWVANRAEGGVSGGESKGSITRIGLVLGGTRCNADGTPNPVGLYLKPPFLYSTAVDRDGDGLIKTSLGLGDIRPWTNLGGVDTHGGVSTADDELIINYTRVAGTNTRTIAIDANNDVWTGGTDLDHEKVDGVTGLPVPGTKFNAGCGGYGGLIDGNGVLWSARFGGGLLRYDPATAIAQCLGFCIGNYGLGIDPNTGHIWQSDLGCDNRLYELDSLGNVVNSYPQPWGAQGVAVDGNSHVWVAEIFGSQVGHWAPDPLNPGQHVYVGAVIGLAGVTGVAVDANGKIWASEINSSGTRGAARIDPLAGPIGAGGYPVGAIDLTVGLDLPNLPPASPYNYSDMTGFVSIGATAPSGTWTVVHDSGTLATAWGTVCWTEDTPAGTAIKVEVRAADTQAALAAQAFVEVANCVSFCGSGIDGQFIEIRTTLSRSASTPDSPILYDLTVKCCNQPPVALCQDVVVVAGADCTADAAIDAGSFDPDGDAIVVVQDPPGPYGLGTTVVTLTVIDPSGETATCTATVTVLDRGAPSAECQPATNPAGQTIPRAGQNPRSGQNPDGFYRLFGSDDCGPAGAVGLYIRDSASPFVAGPFQSGDTVKITQAPGGTPNVKPMAGVVIAHIQLRGDAILYAVDAAGNASAPAWCRVAPPPK